MRRFRKITQWLREVTKDENFLDFIHHVENWISKVLSIALVIIIFVSVVELLINLFQDFISYPVGQLEKNLLEIFGLFLNILIAFELLENITAYLKKHIVQVELVIVTALIAVARKIIIFDFNKYQNFDLAALAFAILSLAISYWLIKRSNVKSKE